VTERFQLQISHVFKAIENRKPVIVGCYRFVQLRSELNEYCWKSRRHVSHCPITYHHLSYPSVPPLS